MKENRFDLIDTGKRAKTAAYILQSFSHEEKQKGLLAAADALEENADIIIAENKKDVEKAESGGTSAAMIDRLRLDEKRIKDMALSVRQIADLDDPTGQILEEFDRIVVERQPHRDRYPGEDYPQIIPVLQKHMLQDQCPLELCLKLA